MGLFNKIIGGSSNKNDVKIAKLELEKAKIENKAKNEKASKESELNRKQEKSSAVEGYLKYCKNNFEIIKNKVLALKKEIEIEVSSLKSTENVKLGFKENNQRKKDKALCESKLKYLYLSKDFLLFMSKYAIGINLNEDQSTLIIKFSRYFDGIQVIEVEENGEDYDDEDADDSVAGMFKDVAKEFKEVFYKSKSSSKKYEFFMMEYLEKYYDDRIDQLEIPEIDTVIETLKKALFDSNDDKVSKEPVVETQNIIQCSSCNAQVLSNVKFCPECGSKIETPQPSVCKGCGIELIPGTKFCPECGQKAN